MEVGVEMDECGAVKMWGMRRWEREWKEIIM